MSRRRSSRHELLLVLREHVHLQVHCASGRGGPQRRALERLGDQRDLEPLVLDRADGERDPVHGDRALLDHVAQQAGRRRDPHDAGVALVPQRPHLSGPVDVPLHHVTAHAVSGAQRQLQVHLGARAERPERGAAQCLRHHVGCEAVRVRLHGRQADPVHGDRVSLGEVRAERGLHLEPPVVDGADGALVCHEPGEHRYQSFSRARISTSSSSRSTSTCRARGAAAICPMPIPSTGVFASRPPVRSGATKIRASSISSASRNAPARCGPPSSSSDWTSRAPSSPSACLTRAASFWPVETITSTPADSSDCTDVREAAREQTTVTGTSDTPRTSWESSGSRASESNTTRRGWRATPSMRAVSRGSSNSAVPMPTATASDSARQRCARARLASPEIHCESPLTVATLPSSVMADLKTTSGRPVRACLRKGWFRRRAFSAGSPSIQTTSTPSSRRIPGPRPAALVVGSSDAITTREMPASRIASVQGGVRPWWAHGSSETYIVAPKGSSSQAASAMRSACAWPGGCVVPSPITRPSLTITAPTIGFGLVCPRTRWASSTALRR